MENVTIGRGSHFFGHFQNSVVLSLQMPELWLIHLFKANILSFLYLYSKLAMPNEIYDVDFPKQTKI